MANETLPVGGDITDLVSSNPTDADLVTYGAYHLRMIKQALQNDREKQFDGLWCGLLETKTVDFVAEDKKRYSVDCSGGPIEITIDSTLEENGCFSVYDYTGSCSDTNYILVTITDGRYFAPDGGEGTPQNQFMLHSIFEGAVFQVYNGEVHLVDTNLDYSEVILGYEPVYWLKAFWSGLLVDAEVLFRETVSFNFLLSGSEDWKAGAGLVSTAAASLAIKKNGVSVGTIDFALGAGTATFTFASDVLFEVDDILSIENQAVADATLGDVDVSLKGVLYAG